MKQMHRRHPHQIHSEDMNYLTPDNRSNLLLPFLLLFLLLSLPLSAQEREESDRDVERQPSTLFEYEQRGLEAGRDAAISSGERSAGGDVELDESESSWPMWQQRILAYLLPRISADGTLPDMENYRIAADLRAEAEAKESRGKSLSSSNDLWIPSGPFTPGISDDPQRQHGLGRINCITFHPSDPDIFWVGVAQGGVWKTVDGGANWMPISDGLPLLRISDIAVDPSDPDIIYAAVGDYGYLGVQMIGPDRKRHSHFGLGLYKTTDGGATWRETGLRFMQEEFSQSLIRRTFIDPANSAHLLAAGTSGVWESEDGGESWERTLDLFVWDIERNPSDPNHFLLSTGVDVEQQRGAAGIYGSTDGGKSWSQSQTELQGASDIGRIELAWSQSEPIVAYAVATTFDGGLRSIQRSDDGGASWSMTASPSSGPNILGRWTGEASEQDQLGGQGLYDLALLVDPFDAERLYVGGINLWGSVDGGVSWNPVSYGTGDFGPSIHPDQHYLAWSPLAERFYLCQDGGVMTTDRIEMSSWANAISFGNQHVWPTEWTDLTVGMNITSFYRLGLAYGPDDGTMIVAGAQDNSTYFTDGESWINLLGGDGMEGVIVPDNPNVLFASAQYGVIGRYDFGAGTGSIISNEPLFQNRQVGEWTTPFLIDPQNTSRLYVAYGNLWVWNDLSQSWTQLWTFPNIPGESYPVPSSALALSPGGVPTIYLAKRPIRSAGIPMQIFRGIPSTQAFDDVTSNLPTSLYPTYLAADLSNPDRAWVTFSGFTEGEKIYQTTDGGESWQNISLNLPNLPANTVVADRNGDLYIGMDVGVYRRASGGSSWQLYSNGLPNVIISELEIDSRNRRLYAATFGRGLWNVELPAADTSGGVERGENRSGTEMSLVSSRNGGRDIDLKIWSATDRSGRLSIIDIMGAERFSSELVITSDDRIEHLHLDLPAGLYFISLESGGERRSLRHVIEGR